MSGRFRDPDVANGIAWDGRLLYVTGELRRSVYGLDLRRRAGASAPDRDARGGLHGQGFRRAGSIARDRRIFS